MTLLITRFNFIAMLPPPVRMLNICCHITMTKSNYSVEICRNMVLAAKENTANLAFLQMRSIAATSSESYLYGNRRCSGSNCLRNAGIKEIDDFCSSCTNNCTLFTYLDHINF